MLFFKVDSTDTQPDLTVNLASKDPYTWLKTNLVKDKNTWYPKAKKVAKTQVDVDNTVNDYENAEQSQYEAKTETLRKISKLLLLMFRLFLIIMPLYE